jgi:activating signal cointegrator complex subunit 3
MSDYVTDLKSVLDQALRVLQAMVDIAADAGWLYSALGAMHLTQMVSHGRFLDGPQLSHLPGIDAPAEAALAARGWRYLPQVIHADERELARTLSRHLQHKHMAELTALLASLPATTLAAAPPPHAVAAGAECALAVTVGATNARTRRAAHAPGFPKARAGGWWLVLGEGGELFALKRVSAPVSARAPPLKTELLLCAPDEPGTYRYDVYLISDSYIGLDQQTTVTLVVE